jgi:hypothetical protein
VETERKEERNIDGLIQAWGGETDRKKKRNREEEGKKQKGRSLNDAIHLEIQYINKIDFSKHCKSSLLQYFNNKTKQYVLARGDGAT